MGFNSEFKGLMHLKFMNEHSICQAVERKLYTVIVNATLQRKLDDILSGRVLRYKTQMTHEFQ